MGKIPEDDKKISFHDRFLLLDFLAWRRLRGHAGQTSPEHDEAQVRQYLLEKNTRPGERVSTS